MNIAKIEYELYQNITACPRNAMGKVSQRYVFAHFVFTITQKAQVAES